MASDKIELHEFLTQLREQLSFAWMDAQNERIRFLAKSIEVEMQMTAKREGNGGLKFWIVELGGKAASDEVQKVKLVLEPMEVDPDDPNKVPKRLFISD